MAIKLFLLIVVIITTGLWNLEAQVITDFKIGEKIYYNFNGRCVEAKVTAILDNVPGYGRRINIVTAMNADPKNTRLVVDPKDLSRKSDCGIQSKEGFKVGDVLYHKDFTGRCKKVEIKNIANPSIISVLLLDGSNTRLNVNPKDLFKSDNCK